MRQIVLRNEMSMRGLISKSLLDYLDPEFYKGHELMGVCAVYVDDTLIAGTEEFY